MASDGTFYNLGTFNRTLYEMFGWSKLALSLVGLIYRKMVNTCGALKPRISSRYFPSPFCARVKAHIFFRIEKFSTVYDLNSTGFEIRGPKILTIMQMRSIGPPINVLWYFPKPSEPSQRYFKPCLKTNWLFVL